MIAVDTYCSMGSTGWRPDHSMSGSAWNNREGEYELYADVQTETWTDIQEYHSTNCHHEYYNKNK